MSAANLAALYRAESGRIRRLVRRITGCPEAAEDVVQDAFLRLNGREVGSADVGLLVRTAQNLALDRKRSDRVRTVYAERTTPEQAATPAAAPDEAVFARRELGELFEALKELPPRAQQALIMSRVEEMTYPQIARALGVSLSTVEKDMISALEFCRTWRRRRT